MGRYLRGHILTYIHICIIYVFAIVYMYVYIHICIYIYTYLHTCTRIHTYAYVCMSNVYTYMTRNDGKIPDSHQGCSNCGFYQDMKYMPQESKYGFTGGMGYSGSRVETAAQQRADLGHS